jgi:TP901 family phage tail tape measure protein
MAIAAEALLRLKTVFDGGGLDAARRALGGLEREAKGVRGSLKDVVSSASWQGAAAAATGIGAGLVYSAKKAIELETQMVQVRKVVDFSGPNGLNKLTQDLVKLSTEIPYTARELGELATAAGQAGYAEQDILKFVKAAAQMGTAFNMPAKEAGEAMVAFQAAMGLPLDDAIKLGDAINTLSDNMKGVVEPRALVDVVKRVGAIGVASGLSAKEVAALGAAFLAPGTNAEVAATGMKNFLKALTIGDAGSKSFKAAFGQIGLDAKQVAKDMQTNALPTIKNVLTRIAALPKELQAGVISQIFGEESKAAIMPLLTNLNLVDEAFALVANDAKFAGSMQKEFNNQLNSTEAQLKIFKNNLDAVAISLGNALLPGINAILGALRPVISAIGFLSQKIPGFSALIVGLGVAFAGLVISAPFITSVITLAGALSRLGILATIAGWLGAVGPWLSRLAPWLLQIGSVVTRIGPLLSSIVPILLGVGRVLLGIFTGPVGWATLLISAGIALYAFRDRIMQFFAWLAPSWNTYVVAPLRALWSMFLTWVGTTFATLGPQLAAAFTGLATAFQSYVVIPIQTIWGIFLAWVRTSLVTAAVSWWMGVTSGFNLYVVQPIQFAFNTLITWIGQAITQLRSWFAMIWTGIAQAFQAYVIIPIQTAWGIFSQFFLQTAANLRNAFTQLWAGVSQAFTSYVVQPVQQGWSALAQFVSQGVNNLRQVLAGAWNGVASGFNGYVVQPLRQGWGSVLQWMQGAATTAARGVATAFSSVARAVSFNMIQPLQQAFRNLVQWIQNIINGLLNYLNGVMARIRSVMSGGGGGGGGTTSSGGRVMPRMYARGGHVSGPTLAWVGEGGDPGGEYIIPAKKMAAASMAYLSGARGASVIPGFAKGGHVGRKGKGDKNTGTYGKDLFSFDNIVAKRYDPSALPRGYGVWQFDPDGNPIPQILVYDKDAKGGGVHQYIPESKWPSFKAELQDSLERQKKERKIAIKRYKNMGYSEKLAEQFAPTLTPTIPTTRASNQSPSSAIPTPPSRPSQSPMGRGSSTASKTLQTLMDRVGPINSPIKNQPSSVADDRPINITTGPVLEFDGKRYVTWTDFEKGLRDVKRQTLGEIRTAAGRRATGR